MLAYSTRKSKRGGGSIQQSLDYLNPSYGTPNAPAGQNLLVEQGGVARPMIGGFIPSVMKGVVNSGALLGPLVAIEAKRMMNGNGTRKRRGGGKTENWQRNYASARNFLRQHGKPSGPNISRYAKKLREDPAAAEAFLNEFKAREFAKEQEKAMKKTRRAPRKTRAPAIVAAPMATASGPIRHVFYNSSGKVLGEELVPRGQLSKLVVNVTGKVRDITEQLPAPNSFTIGEEIPVVNETMAAIAKEVAATRPSEAFKMGKIKKSKGPLTTIAEGNETINLTMPAAKKEKGTRKVSNEWKAMYAQAKANLAAAGKKATAPQISTLAALRKRGESNAEFLERYRQGIAVKPTAPPADVALAGEKRTRKVSNEYKAAYAKAKANLAATIGKNPLAHQISTLARIRKMGLPNAEYLEKIKQAAAAPPVVVDAVRKVKAPVVAPVAAAPVAAAEAPGLLQTIMSMVAPAAQAAPAATQKRQYKRSNNVVAAYEKAKANLAATGKKPKAQQIAALSAIRRRGEDNSAFFNEYTRTPQEEVIDLNASSAESERSNMSGGNYPPELMRAERQQAFRAAYEQAKADIRALGIIRPGHNISQLAAYRFRGQHNAANEFLNRLIREHLENLERRRRRPRNNAMDLD